MRPLIRYDLDEPPLAASALESSTQTNARRPPVKKRKRNHQDHRNHPPPKKALPQHWDDPGSTAVGMVYDEEEGGATTSASLTAGSVAMSHVEDGEMEEEGYNTGEGAEWGEAADAEQEEGEGEGEGEEQSRPLTYDEIWDDSALIDAWNSAEAEYEAYHGTSKTWKKEPVKKSPLWYNKPYTPPAPQPGPSKPKSRSKPVSQEQTEPDTAPLDFDTYVPTHDPSLGIPSDPAMAGAAGIAMPPTNVPFFVPSPSTTMVGRDEAFNNALSAMYWSGYWTAVYQCQSQTNGKKADVQTEAIEGRVETDEDESGEDLVPAQR